MRMEKPRVPRTANPKMRTGACDLLIGSLALALANAIALAQSPAVHQFSSIRTLPDRIISITLTGSVPAADQALFDNYALEASPDLVAWTPP